MPINFNNMGFDHANFNDQPVDEIYFNNFFVWPNYQTIYYKFVFLEHINKKGVNENTYELHISSGEEDAGYKKDILRNKAPAWQNKQLNVVGPNGEPYATPLAFVRRVVIDRRLSPVYINNWFNHLYGGINHQGDKRYDWLKEEYPFEWVNFDKLNTTNLQSFESTFERCHAPYIDLTAWDNSHIYITTNMFKNCSAEHIYISDSWTVEQVVDSKNMFKDAMYLPNYHSSKVDKSMAKSTTRGGYLELR